MDFKWNIKEYCFLRVTFFEVKENKENIISKLCLYM